MKFIYYGVKPAIVLQPFGASPAYYAKFLDTMGNPEKGHPGIDFQASHATPLFAECDGHAFYATDTHGGDGIYINTIQEGQRFNVINWHLCSKYDPQFKPVIPTDGTMIAVKTGDLIGFTDNSGAPYESSGEHLHLGLIPLDSMGNALYPTNGFNGCVDPTPYLIGQYAQDVPKLSYLYEKLIPLLQQWLNNLRSKSITKQS